MHIHLSIDDVCMPEDEELKKELEAPKVSYSKMEINLSSARRVFFYFLVDGDLFCGKFAYEHFSSSSLPRRL